MYDTDIDYEGAVRLGWNADAKLRIVEARVSALEAQAAEKPQNAGTVQDLKIQLARAKMLHRRRAREIEPLLAQVEALEKENAALKEAAALSQPAPPEPVPEWQPESGGWRIHPMGEPPYKVAIGQPIDAARVFGFSRATEHLALCAANTMRSFNRLLAYRDEAEPGFYAYAGTTYYWVVYDTDDCEWMVQLIPARSRQPQLVYFSTESAASDLAAKLNSGEVTL